ncbi:MAG: hypothetical protein OHK0026_02180 [Rhodocyclaceae bacterium]
MIVGDDQLDTREAAPDQAVEESAPMDLGLGQGDRHTEYAAPAVLGDADGDQHGAIDQLAGLTHPLVAGVEEQVRSFVERPFAPGGQPGVELLGGTADLGRGDRHFRPQELDEDVAHLASRDALHVHLGQGEVERLLGARALLQGARVEAAAAHLRYVEGLFAQAGHDGLWLEAVGIVGALRRAFMRSGIEKVGALDLAGLVDQDAQRLAGAVQAVSQQGRKRGVQGMMFYSLCHGVDSFVGGCENAPKKSPAGRACRGRAAKPVGYKFTEEMLH